MGDNQVSNSSCFAFVGACFCVLMSSHANAGDFSWDGQFIQRFSAEDNVQLSDPKEGALYSTSILSAGIDYDSHLFGFSLDSEFSLREFDGPGVDDNNLNHLQQSYQTGFYSKGKKTQISVDGGLNYSPVSFSEYDDSGNVNDSETTRISHNIGATISHTIDSRSKISFTSGYSGVDFSNDASSLTPYENVSFSSSFSRSLTKTIQLSTSANWSRFETDATTKTKSDSLNLNMNVSAELTKRLSSNFTAGATFIDTETGTETSDTYITVFSAGLNYALPSDFNMSANFSRQSRPSSLGELQVTNSIALGLSKKTDSRSSLGLNLSLSNQSGLSDSSSERDYITFGTDYTYQLSDDTRLGINYSFRQQKVSGVTSHSNKISAYFAKSFN